MQDWSREKGRLPGPDNWVFPSVFWFFYCLGSGGAGKYHFPIENSEN